MLLALHRVPWFAERASISRAPGLLLLAVPMPLIFDLPTSTRRVRVSMPVKIVVSLWPLDFSKRAPVFGHTDSPVDD